MSMETVVFIISAAIVLTGAVGVIAFRNPVHNALSLVGTLFGVAVLFVAMEAHLLAAVQVIVYAGAIVILFLFVIMLLGVDKADSLREDPLPGQRPLAILAGLAFLGLLLVALLVSTDDPVSGGQALVAGVGDRANVEALARVLFSQYVFAFEITALLLTIAVVGAVVLAKRPPAGSPLAAEDEAARSAGES
jgi:NADH-quinone oxidoreductase subunit J